MWDYVVNSKFVAGITMLIVNLGSKYLAQELSDNQEEWLNNIIIRRFIVFTVVFMATKDIFVSLVLTGVFIILVSGLFNEQSKYCIMKKNPKKHFKKITKNKYLAAKKTIQLYDLQQLNL
jgi:hypothetical protein